MTIEHRKESAMTPSTSSTSPSGRSGRRGWRILVVGVLVALGSMSTPAWADPAAEGFSIEISPTQVEVGDTVTVTLSAQGVSELFASVVDLGFDPAVLDYVEDSVTTDLSGYGESDRQGAGTVRYVHTKLGTSPPASGDVVLVTATFEAVGAGSTVVTAELEASDADGVTVGFGTVAVSDEVVVTGDDGTDGTDGAGPGSGSDGGAGAGGGADSADDVAAAGPGTGAGSLPSTGAEITGLMLVLALVALLIGTAILSGQRRRLRS